MPRRFPAGAALLLSTLVAVIPPALIMLVLGQEWGPLIALTSATVHGVSYLVIGFFVFIMYYDRPAHRIWRLPYVLSWGTLLAFLLLLIITTVLEPGFQLFPQVILFTLLYGPISGFSAWLLRPHPAPPNKPIESCSSCTPKAIRD